MKDLANAPDDLQMLPVADLTLSPLNTRQSYTEQEIADMAASIGTVGLIQNLSGHRTDDGTVQIVAGGKRLAALQKLAADEASLSHFDTVPVRLTDNPGTARAWSLAENTARSRPHPADEIRAFGKLFAEYGDPDLIARTFGETTDHVRRRLALATLPEDVLDALRADAISLNTAQTLTLATSTDQQSQLLAQLSQGTLHPNGLRSALQRDAIPATDRRVEYVGLVRYIAEGGTVTEDLFGDSSLLHDEKLLNDLFKAKLQDAAEAARADEGWSWATPIFESYVPWQQIEKLETLYRTPGELSEADQERLEQLDELHGDGALDEAGQAELEALETRLDGDFTDEDRATGGIFVHVDNTGELTVKRAFRRKQDRPTPEGADTPDTDAPIERTATPPITQAMADDLDTIARHALQSAVVAKFELLLDLLAFQMVNNAPSWRSPFNLQLNEEKIETDKDHGLETDVRLATPDGWTPNYTQSPEEMLTAFTDFRALGKSNRNSVLAQALTRSLQLPQGATLDLGKLLAQEAGMNIRRHWTPGEPFFKSARPDVLDRWWADLLGLEDEDPRIAEFGRKKKGEKARALAELFADTSVQEAHGLTRDQIAAIDTWLPPQLEDWK